MPAIVCQERVHPKTCPEECADRKLSTSGSGHSHILQHENSSSPLLEWRVVGKMSRKKDTARSISGNIMLA